MTGEIAQTPHEEEGPEADGVLLVCQLQPVVPHALNLAENEELQRPYWRSDVHIYPIIGEKERELYFSLSHGTRTKPELMKEIKGYVAARVKVPELPADVLKNRARLLAAADTQIKDGLRTLAKTYPQLLTTNYGTLADALAEKQRTDTICIYIGHYSGHKGGVATPMAKKDTFSVIVVLNQHTPADDFGTVGQLGVFPLYPNIQLGGQVVTSAGDPKLAAALKKLVEDALAPLAKLDETVGKAGK
ncbi:MAG: hypothetical protein ACYDBB_21975 [Armatimonadota bacterium]